MNIPKIINHNNNLSYTFKTFIAGGHNILSISIATMFSLTRVGNLSDRLFSSQQLESIVQSTFGSQKPWDYGIPKGVGEFLAVGSAYIPQHTRVGEAGNHNPDKASEPDKVIIKVANLSKQVFITKTESSNITGFKPFSAVSPKLNDVDFSQGKLVIPNGAAPEDFNTAPLDQRLGGFYQGDESIEISNMHILFPTIRSSLPGIRPRIFAIQAKEGNPDAFLEMVVQADTLWLLPNQECAILVYRATCQIASTDSSDIKGIYTVVEELKQEAKPLDYYLQHLLKISTPAAPSAAPETPSEIPDNMSAAQLNTTEKIIDEEVIASNPDEAAHEKAPEPDTAKVETTINADINEEEMILDVINKAESGELSNLAVANDPYKVLLGKLGEVIAQFKITENDTKEFMQQRKEAGLSPYPLEDELLDMYKDVWSKDPKMEESFRNSLAKMKKIREDAITRLRQDKGLTYAK